MAARTVVLTVEYVSHDTGLWCNTCLLSNGARVWWTSRMGNGETRLRSDVFCTEGGREHDVTED